MKLNPFFSPIAAAIRLAALRLSMADGKPGLSEGDFAVLISRAAALAKDNTDKSYKAQALAAYIRNAFGGKLPAADRWSWVPGALGWAAVLVGRRLGLLV
jgi:outer membrane biogenesis lipoprotein LolB